MFKRIGYKDNKRGIGSRIKRIIVIFAVSNLIAFILLPSVFYGFWGTISNVTEGTIRVRRLYHIRRSHGRTVADLVESIEIWKDVPNAINPMNWGR